MKIVLILLHISVCIALIMIVLLQRGKGAGMGAAFGGSSQTVFGSSGATSFLHKVTTGAAIIFMLTSLGLSFFFGKGTTSSLMENVTPTEAPVAESTQTPAETGEAGDKRQ
ncbi:MAG: preprotein translocase subunit SecG [Deltaproteobacteria bacterium]|nr:preprotein translocase subunit SecG [Deltaproteobacteria bacterium]